MATAETVSLGAAHAPKDESIKAFSEILPELKAKLVHARRTYGKHEPEYFAAVTSLSDDELASFGPADFESVRVGVSAYGLHLFGKVQIPALPGAYIHFRAHVPGGDEPAKLHSIHTEEREMPDGDKKYRAIFTIDDALEWFDT